MNYPLLVCGMHRSGTSLLSNLLADAGMHMGGNLLVYKRDNPKGHFENMDFLEFHKSVLNQKHLPRNGMITAGDQLEFDDDQDEIASKLIQENQTGGSQPWGWKDPRTTLFLSSWFNICPDIRVIGIFRTPDQVADSLVRRDYHSKVYPTRNILKRIIWKLDYEVGYSKSNKFYLQVWRFYNQTLLNYFTLNHDKSILFSLEDIVNHPGQCIAAVNKKFGITLSSPNDGIYESRFLKQNQESSGLPQDVLNVLNSLEEVRWKVE